MGFFNNLNDKMQNFMVGRNGADRLARWSIGAAILFMLLNMLFSNIVFFAISYALLFYCFYRIFSRKIDAREAEDERFSEFLDKAAFWRRGSSSGRGDSGAGAKGRPDKDLRGNNGSASRSGSAAESDREKLRIACDRCGQSLSVPKGRGTLKVTCPKCHCQMKVRS